MSKQLKSVFIAGILAALIFICILMLGLGVVFMFLPTLPLFYLGLQGIRQAPLRATAIATLIILFTIGISSAIVFFLFFALPACHISNLSMRWRPTEDGMNKDWFPVAYIFTNLALYAAAFIAITTLYYSGTPGGLPEIMGQNIRETFKDLGDEYADVVELMARDWSFFVFPVTIWLWAIGLFVHAWLANRLLAKNKLNMRPDFAIHVFTMPGWMLYLLALSALASLIGSPSMQFLGKACLITLLLPYFFLGAALTHRHSQKWPSRKFFLFFLYFMMFSQLWPALAMAAVGIGYQVKNLNKRLPQGGSSSNN
jgi:hypothetical protein